ncbi:hypothetical protein RGQ15_18980 [Paracoccus sp. MBLB3053]|uniref:Uncharacterized protein n=1 Tax=Paracoccus aurantius TaxID=3073814 RepID=A0ABU2HYP5_9RHOB|nr:hypothetical protein [Paracoccus sp. MBLB3053]MDS9469655.1 hypothetical protein [Paracoccus sp. MBLB3053]
MPTFSEMEFDQKMAEIREYLVEACQFKGIPLQQLAEAASRVNEMDPMRYVFDDGGNGARAEFHRLLTESGMSDENIEELGHIFYTMQYDRFGDFFSKLVYNVYTPGPVISTPPPGGEAWDGGQRMLLGDFDFENVLGDPDDDTNVTRHRIENPCMLTVVGPEGAPVDYAIPGWSCVLAGIIVAAAAIGDSALGFLDRVVDGFRKTGRELKRFAKKAVKLIKKLF